MLSFSFSTQSGCGELHPRDGDVVPGKGLIQGVSAVHAFCQLFSDPRVTVYDRVTGKDVCPIEVLATLRNLRTFLKHEGDMAEASQEFIRKLKDASATDPARRLRTENLYLSFLTRLPGEENEEADDDDSIIITKTDADATSPVTPLSADARLVSGRSRFSVQSASATIV